MTPRLLLLLSLAALTLVCLALVATTILAKIRRTRRTRTLARLAAPHRLLLLEVASGEDEDSVAADALAALPAREWASIRPAVIAMLSKVRGLPAEQIVGIIAAHGEVDVARTRLHARTALHRARAAHLLGLVRDEASVPRLLELLADPADDVRLVATRSLGAIGDPSAAAAVLAAVPGSGGRVGVPAWVAAESLLSMGSGVEPALLDALRHTDPGVREVVVTVVTHSTLPTAIAALRRALPQETHEDVQVAMITALGRVGDVEDVAILSGYLGGDTPPALRRAAAGALGELGDAGAAPALRPLLADEDRRLAAVAAEALARLGAVGVELLHAARAQGRDAGRIAAAALHLARLRENAQV